MTPCEVRDADEHDLEMLLLLYAELAEGDAARSPADADMSRVVLADIIEDPRRHLCVAAFGDGLVGTAELLVIPDLTHQGRPWAVIENVVVTQHLGFESVAEGFKLYFDDTRAVRSASVRTP